jgi:hypothetical protein
MNNLTPTAFSVIFECYIPTSEIIEKLAGIIHDRLRQDYSTDYTGDGILLHYEHDYIMVGVWPQICSDLPDWLKSNDAWITFCNEQIEKIKEIVNDDRKKRY